MLRIAERFGCCCEGELQNVRKGSRFSEIDRWWVGRDSRSLCPRSRLASFTRNDRASWMCRTFIKPGTPSKPTLSKHSMRRGQKIDAANHAVPIWSLQPRFSQTTKVLHQVKNISKGIATGGCGGNRGHVIYNIVYKGYIYRMWLFSSMEYFISIF